jgi:hypothetical protein
MSWAHLSFDNLVYQYIDNGGAPDPIEAWAVEDLELLASHIQQELQRRALQPGASR